MNHKYYATDDPEIDEAYRIPSTFSGVNKGDIVEISFPDKPTKILLVSSAQSGCKGCALDVLEDYCEVVNSDGAPLCMACSDRSTIFKDLDIIMEDL